MPKPRRQKFIRSEETDPLKLTSRDLELIRDVAEFRFLNTEQLLALHEGSRRNIVERLESSVSITAILIGQKSKKRNNSLLLMSCILSNARVRSFYLKVRMSVQGCFAVSARWSIHHHSSPTL